MNVSIIGSGNMARGISTRLLAGGNSVTLVARNVPKAAELAKQLGSAATHGATITTVSLGSPIPDDIIVLAVPYSAAAAIVQNYGQQFAGKLIVDITNPLNATFDGLATAPDTSAAEEIAKVAPAGAKVVKAFNTNFGGTLAAGQIAGQPLDVFIAGDDAEAKTTLAHLIEAGGLHALDVGPLKRARQLEGFQFLFILLQSKLDKPWMSTVKILA